MPEPRPLFRLDLRAGQRWLTATHEFWYRMTGGLVGGNFFGTPMLLTTTGRRSGRKRITPLTYLEDGANYVIIASNGGSAEDPQWWRNLQRDPAAEIQVMNRTIAVDAREAEGDERARLWQKTVSRFPVYAGYERRTSRLIPVVVLTPR
jgi:deazaflavin-dependent oxidoreductase (nitroreductase family)